MSQERNGNLLTLFCFVSLIISNWDWDLGTCESLLSHPPEKGLKALALPHPVIPLGWGRFNNNQSCIKGQICTGFSDLQQARGAIRPLPPTADSVAPISTQRSWVPWLWSTTDLRRENAGESGGGGGIQSCVFRRMDGGYLSWIHLRSSIALRWVSGMFIYSTWMWHELGAS